MQQRLFRALVLMALAPTAFANDPADPVKKEEEKSSYDEFRQALKRLGFVIAKAAQTQSRLVFLTEYTPLGLTGLLPCGQDGAFGASEAPRRLTRWWWRRSAAHARENAPGKPSSLRPVITNDCLSAALSDTCHLPPLQLFDQGLQRALHSRHPTCHRPESVCTRGYLHARRSSTSGRQPRAK